jgi:hypothetical protein
MKAPITKVTHSAARNITKYLNAVIIGFIVFGLVIYKANKLFPCLQIQSYPFIKRIS